MNMSLCVEYSRKLFDSLYEVGQVLGGGGFGTVYSAKRRYDDLPVSYRFAFIIIIIYLHEMVIDNS